MAKPTDKTEELEAFIDSITPNPLGRKGSITNDLCALCIKPAVDFRNEISKKEYTISGMCQDCQDKVFGKD